MSHSARSAWIETIRPACRRRREGCRTPQGVRGLKHQREGIPERKKQSHSARSAWIETGHKRIAALKNVSRTPQGVRGLKLISASNDETPLMSHSARSAWIETMILCAWKPGKSVALRKECVD